MNILIVAAIALVLVLLLEKAEFLKYNEQFSSDSLQQADKLKSKSQGDLSNIGIENGPKQESVEILEPISGAASRVTKKPFGIYITPKTSPVQPERFQGYHVGTDFEITLEEQNIDVPIKAICEGELLEKRFVSGYGGVVVEECILDNNAVTVVYGHLRLSSMNTKVGDRLKAGDFMAYLGTGYSPETDGERKHLHLGIHKGEVMDMRGYVSQENKLVEWLNPCDFICR